MKNIILLLLLGFMPMCTFADANADLLKAAESGSEYDVKAALKKGADVFAKNQYELTAFYYAALHGHIDVLKVLLQNVKKPSLKQKIILSDTLVAIGGSAQKGSDEERADIAKHLIRIGADVNHYHSRDGDTPLTHAASSHRREKVMQVLLVHGAKVNLPAKGMHDYGKTALMNAARWGSMEGLKILLKARADINATDAKGNTAIMSAVGIPSTAKVQLLIENKANLNIKNKAGWTALHWANAKNYKDMVALLQAAGAKDEPLPADFQAVANYSLHAGSAPKKVDAGSAICLTFRPDGSLMCTARAYNQMTCPGQRNWGGPGPCAYYKNKKVQELDRKQWSDLIAVYTYDQEDRNKVDEPAGLTKTEQCTKACVFKRCTYDKRKDGNVEKYTAHERCVNFCKEACRQNPNMDR